MKEYLKSTEEVLKDLQSNSNGLTTNGYNKLKEPPKDGIIKKFFKSLMDPMIIMLLAAAAISGVTAIMSGDSLTDVVIILFVVIVNTILGMVQETKAEHASLYQLLKLWI